MTEYSDRQGFELSNWPELRQMVNQLASLVYSERLIEGPFKLMLFSVAAISNQSVH